jgi:hypothetical protein
MQLGEDWVRQSHSCGLWWGPNTHTVSTDIHGMDALQFGRQVEITKKHDVVRVTYPALKYPRTRVDGSLHYVHCLRSHRVVSRKTPETFRLPARSPARYSNSAFSITVAVPAYYTSMNLARHARNICQLESRITSLSSLTEEAQEL